MGLLRLVQRLIVPSTIRFPAYLQLYSACVSRRKVWLCAIATVRPGSGYQANASVIGGRTTLLSPLDSGLATRFPPLARSVSTKQRRKWKVRKYHFKLRLKRTMRKMRVPYVSSKSRGQVKKKPILYDFRPYLRRKLKRAER
jgi:hypothetical protein